MFVKTATPSPSLDALGPASLGVPVIDTNTLRRAALQNSWQRDQRVARRRLAVRWVLWWLWKYRYYLLALCAVLVCVVYLVYRLDPAWRPAHGANTAPDTSQVPQTELRLRMQSQMLLPSDKAVKPALSIPLYTDSFQLKPETQLNIKETNP
jgi:hypothetical protein